jgi:FMN phosphatase YigB (HAD superfamily)
MSDVNSVRFVFLDDGGVINDNALRAPQWRRLVGEFFVPRLGGTMEAWAEANREALQPAIEAFFRRVDAWQTLNTTYVEEIRRYELDWLARMCAGAQVDLPASEEDCATLAREATDWIMPQVRADFPGGREAIQELADRYGLYMASSGASFELEASLRPLGVTALFRRLYGPDLVNFPKRSRGFYERIFSDAGVDPAQCLVVDDKTEVLSWAREAGARTTLVASDGAAEPGRPDLVVASLAELPAVLPKLG